jgi:hypothetical protein
MNRLYKIYVFLLSLLGFGLGCGIGLQVGGMLGLSAIGPMGAIAGFFVAALGRHIFGVILELLP